MPSEDSSPPSSTGSAPSLPLALYALIFTFTGVGGLVLEVVWQRRLSLLFGNTVEATGAVLAAFLGSLAVGNAVLGPLADRVRNPLRLYGILEVTAGLGALFSLATSTLLGDLGAAAYRAFGHESIALNVVRCLLAFALVAPATIPMGGTLPAIAAALTRGKRMGDTIGLLYGLNTIGAAAGAALSAFVFIVYLGIQWTWLGVAALDVTLGLLVVLLARDGDASVPVGLTVDDDDRPISRPVLMTLAALVFTSGAVVLALEVLWTRALVLHLGSHVATFALVLATVLIGLGGGALVGGRLSELGRDRVTLMGVLAILASLAGALGIVALRGLPEFMVGLATVFGTSTYWGTMGIEVLATAQVILLPAFLAGCILPLGMREAVTRGAVGQRLGLLVATSTAGTLVGSLGTAFVLVPIMGVGRPFAVVLVLQLTIGIIVVILRRPRWPSFVFSALALAGMMLLLHAVSPLQGVLLEAGVFDNPATKVLYAEDGRHGLVTVEEVTDAHETYRSLSVNGVNVAGTAHELIVVQKLQAHIPLLLHADPKTILHIGIGSGGTAYSASRHALDRIDIVELNPRVPPIADEFFAAVNHGVIVDEPRVRLLYGDGRTLLLATDDTYDVILSDSVHPRFAGNGALYTRDYYQLCRKRLNPGGVVSQWLPLYSLPPEGYAMIVRAFLDVFPDAILWYPHDTLNPNSILIGARDGFSFSTADLAARLAVPAIAADLAEIGINSAEDFLDNYVTGRHGLERLAADVPPHTDDRPLVEYTAGRLHGEHFVNYRDWTWKRNFAAIVAVREPWDSARGGQRSDRIGRKFDVYLKALSQLAP